MLKPVNSVLFLLLLVVNLAFAQPKNIQLEYEVTQEGKPFATVKESFVQDGKQYRIVSITRGAGVYALLGERKLVSSGEITPRGLKPARFELYRAGNPKKTLIADFDWKHKELKMQVKGKIKTASLTRGAQDLASYVYQFMYTPPKKNVVKVTLTTGKKLKLYTYDIVGRGVMLKAGDVRYKTTHLSNSQQSQEDKKELWLAEDYHYIPVRYRLVDGDAKLEQTLTSIHVE